MVMKRKTEGPIEYIFMRQVFIGQSERNVFWVNGNIFDKTWENKQIMEQAMSKDPLLSIVPKVSTQCALAFLNSQVGQHRNQNYERYESYKRRIFQRRRARLIKACQKMFLIYKIMIFASNKEKVEQILKRLDVALQGADVTVKSQRCSELPIIRKMIKYRNSMANHEFVFWRRKYGSLFHEAVDFMFGILRFREKAILNEI